jgi:hypothetical protein
MNFSGMTVLRVPDYQIAQGTDAANGTEGEMCKETFKE